MQTHIYKRLLFPLILSVVLLTAILPYIIQIKQFDLVQYYAAAKQLAIGSNPYNIQELYEIEKAAAREFFEIPEPVVLYATPLVLPLIYPLHYLDFYWSKVIWFTASLLSIVFLTSIYISRLTTQNSKFLTLALVFSIVTFSPIYSMLWYGQISWLLYIGWISFLLLYDRRPVLAGMFLSLTFIKPHLLYLIYLLLLFHLKDKKVAKSFLGLFTGLTLLVSVALILNTNIFTYYLEFSKNPPIFWQTLNLGSWLQELLDIHNLSVRFAPTIITIILFALFYLPTKLHNKQLNLDYLIYLSPLSILTAPYGWIFDCVLLLPFLVLIGHTSCKIGRLNFLLYINTIIATIIIQLTIRNLSQSDFIWVILSHMLLYLCLLKLPMIHTINSPQI